MNVYNLSWPVFNEINLPSFNRYPIIKALLNACTIGISMLHSDFLAFRLECLYRVRHNSQKASMEEVLNDIFDPELKRIRIATTEIKLAVWLYEPEDDKPVYLYEPEDNKPVYLYESEEIAGDGIDFSVCVPPDLQPVYENDLADFLSRMRAEVEYYKLYSKNYNIKWVLIND